jgi:hypothetical protein
VTSELSGINDLCVGGVSGTPVWLDVDVITGDDAKVFGLLAGDSARRIPGNRRTDRHGETNRRIFATFNCERTELCTRGYEVTCQS